ncbi:MAG: ABC transporter permease subunit [Streptosporangiales bacterium]|nr:ABC transporter permease subunit [Streptosporangiales bacterium]
MSATGTVPAVAGTAPPVTTPRRRRRGGGRGLAREIIVSLILLPICLLWIYPFLWMVGASLKSDSEIFGRVGILPETPVWENYARAWYEANIGPYFFNTLIVTVAVIAIVTVTTAMIGYVIGRYPFPGKKVLVGVLVASLFLPEGYTIIPVFDLVNSLGLSGSLWGIILAESGGAHVIQIMLFAGYFRQLPRELEEAARMDGAGFLRIFWQVMLPLAKPAIATAIIMTLMRVWNSFLIPLVLTLPRPELRTLAVGVYSFQGENFTDWSGMAAASTIALLPIVVVFLLLQRYFVEGVAGAVRA